MKMSDDILHINKTKKEKRYENTFNQFFICNDSNVIKTLYTKINDSAIWSHPLILNYNYCLFCLEYSKSPYSLSFLDQSHIKVNDLYEYFKFKGINFKYNKLKPITKKIRRLIKSQDSKRIVKSDTFNQDYNRSTSDTNIYFDINTKGMQALNKYKQRAKRLLPHESKTKNENKRNERIFERKNEVKTDNVNIKTYKKRKTPKEFDMQILKYFDDDNNNESLSLTEYNDNNTFVISNPLYTSLQINNKLNFTDNVKHTPKSNQNTCDICFQELKDKLVLSCGDFYCKNCLRIYILDCINNLANFNKIHCPKEICKSKLSETDLNKLLSNEELSKYYKIKTRIEGLSNPSLIPCPYPDCESYSQLKQLKSKSKICKCSNNHKYCSKCLGIIKRNSLEHKCLNNKAKKNETLDYLSKNQNIKRCPNCHSYIQRELDKGCNNMTCTNPWCEYQFCWICEKQYDAYHYRNPFSYCFGLSETDLESKLVKYKIMRVGKCILIFILLLFIIFPICVAIFSIIAVGLYVFAFVIDGSITKNIKIKEKRNKNIFNAFIYLFYAFYGLAFIPLGYIAFAFGIIALPVYCVVQRQLQIKHDASSEG